MEEIQKVRPTGELEKPWNSRFTPTEHELGCRPGRAGSQELRQCPRLLQ